MGRYIQCIFVYFCIWRVATAERVAQRHRTEANGDDPVAVIVINDPPAPAVEVKQEPLSTKALNALIKEDTCSLCGHKAGRTNKRVHITTKHPEITSDNHPLVIAKLAAALPNIMKSMASAPKAVSVQVRVMEFFAAHSIPHQIVESPYWRAMLLAIRTQGDMELCKSRKTFATKLDEHSSCKLQQALADRCGSCGYLSIDSGTVIHRYLGVVLHTPRHKPLCVAAIHDGTFDDGTLCTKNIVAGINRVSDLCAPHKICIGAVVSDNCANVAKAAAECGRIPVRCMAHSLQLSIKDGLTAGRWQQITAYLEEFRAVNPTIPGRCETRWSWLYLAIEKLLSMHSDSSLVAPVRDRPWELLEKLASAQKVLAVFYNATQKLQANTANAFTTIKQISDLISQLSETNPALSSAYREPMRTACASRIRQFYLVEDWMSVVAYFHPAVDRASVPETLLTVVSEFIAEFGETTVHALEGQRGAGVRDVTGDFNDSLVNPPVKSVDEEHNVTSYILYWTKTRLPRLTAFLRVLVALPPTEAEVERAFSKLKRMVPRLRANLAPERVEGALILMSLLDGEDEEATTTWTTDDSPLSVHAANNIIELYSAAHGAERADRGKETRSKTMTCLKCLKHLTEHSNADSFSCKVCQRRCACECSEL
jgi:hypothetical protein